jgi:hypothetical protein
MQSLIGNQWWWPVGVMAAAALAGQGLGGEAAEQPADPGGGRHDQREGDREQGQSHKGARCHGHHGRVAEGTATDPQHGLGDHRQHGRGQPGEDRRHGGGIPQAT